jgi:hypothetical protein
MAVRIVAPFFLAEEEIKRKESLPIGVWAHDPATNDLNIAFLPEYWEEEFEATQPLNGLIEQDLPIPLDFFDYWNEHISSHKGDRGPIQDTEEFDNVVQLTNECFKNLTTTY